MNSTKIWRIPRKRLRYTTEHSLMLLKEVLDRNPFEDPYRWSLVHENFVRMTGRLHTLRSVREHVDYLLKLYVKGVLDRKAIGKNDDEHQEKLQMLQEVLSLKEKYFEVIQERRPTKKLRTDSNNEIKILDESTDMFLDDELKEETLMQQHNSSDPLEYIHETSTSESTPLCDKDNESKYLEQRKKAIDIKERKLNLAEAEFQLAKEKFELEKEERTKRLEIEIQERTAQLKVLEQQQKIISILFQQLENNYTT